MAIGLTPVLATDETGAGKKAKESFEKEFVGARFVEWSREEDYLKVVFVFREHRLQAYYNSEGVLEGFARAVLFKELPLAVKLSLGKRCASADLNNILEITNTEGTSYRVTAEMENKRYRVKANPNGTILKTHSIK